jgi:hypothetical protein
MAAGDDPAVWGLEGEITVRVRGVAQPGEVKVFVRGTYERFIAHSDVPIQLGARVLVQGNQGPRAVEVVPVLVPAAVPVAGESGTATPDHEAPSDLPGRLDGLLAEPGGALPERAREQLQGIRAGVFTLTRYPLSDLGLRKVDAVVNAVVERTRVYLALIRPTGEDRRQLTEQLGMLADHADRLLGDLDRDLRTGIKAMDAGLVQRFGESELDIPE